MIIFLVFLFSVLFNAIANIVAMLMKPNGVSIFQALLGITALVSFVLMMFVSV